MAGVDIMYLEPSGIGIPFRKHITPPVGFTGGSFSQLPREVERGELDEGVAGKMCQTNNVNGYLAGGFKYV